MDQNEYEQLLADAETRIDRLKALYEQYFQGIERLEPVVPRKELERRLNILRKEKPRNTALRFRFQSLQQRWNTYQTYWQRIARQIEEGTYRRDLLRARRLRVDDRARRDDSREPEIGGPLELDIDLEADGLGELDVDRALDALDRRHADVLASRAERESAAPPTPPPPTPPPPAGVALSPFGTAARKPTQVVAPNRPASEPPPETQRRRVSVYPPPTPVGGLPAVGATPRVPPPPPAPGRAPDEDRIRQIYESYVDARRKNNERIDNVRYETLARSIRQMVPKLQKKHEGKRIDFEIVVKDGRVGLKPVARK